MSVSVDGSQAVLRAEPRLLLSDALREVVGCRRVHVGCEQGVCGSCTVLLDGQPIRSCLALAVEVEGRRIDTFDGLVNDATMQRILGTIATEGGLQCGYCTPGVAMAIYAAVAEQDLPSSCQEAREFLEAHLCRCTGYEGLVAVVRTLAPIKPDLETTSVSST